jgi:small subunit ribosomal protein S5
MADEAQNTAPAAAVTPTPAAAPPAPQNQAGGPGRGGHQGGPRRRGPRTDMPQEEKQFDERTLHIDRVARVVKGGRRFRFRALVVVGDRKGKVGIGIAKGADVTAAVSKATEVGKKHMLKVATYKGTLPHESQAKVGGAVVLLKPASAGTGLIAGGVVRTVLEVAGISNALSKSLGSTNKVNSAYATMKALELVQPASKWVTAKPAAAKKATKKIEKVAA